MNSENLLTSQDYKNFWKLSCASSPAFNIASKVAIDYSNSNSNSNTSMRLSIPFDLGPETGNTARNLCPRQHMDKLSEYYFELILKYK